jgi:hypothetical protein
MKFTLIASMLVLIAGNKAYAGLCDREELMKGFNPSSSVIFGIGLSNDKDKLKSSEEAKQRAYQDIVTQLRANVESTMTLEETDKSTAYRGIVNVQTNVDKIIGIKFFKETSDSSATSCMAYTLDVAAAYRDAVGFMRVLDKKLEDVIAAQKSKQYVEVVRRYDIAKKDIEANNSSILRADMYKTYLKENGISWWEKFKIAETDLDKTYEEAKRSIIFYIDEFPKYEEVALDAESMIGSRGFTVQKGGVKSKEGIEIEFKEAGIPRKTKSALGYTIVYKFGVVIKDRATGRVLGTNKGATVQGFSNDENEDDALASASKQMSLNVMEAVKTAIPGLIQD